MEAYLPTLPVFPVVSKFFIKSPGKYLPWPFQNFFIYFVVFERRWEHSEGLRMIFGEYSDIVENDILRMQRFLDVSRFLCSGGWQVCGSEEASNIFTFVPNIMIIIPYILYTLLSGLSALSGFPGFMCKYWYLRVM